MKIKMQSAGGSGGSKNELLNETMTSNTSPSGYEAFGGNSYQANTEWYAFNDNITNFWASSTKAVSTFIGLKFPNPVCVKYILVASRNSVTYTLQGSNDNSAWTDLGNVECGADSISRTEINNNNKYTYYRLRWTSSTGNCGIYSIYMFGTK